MKIALAQLNFIIADFKGNAKKIIDAIEMAKKSQTDLIVFSELAVCGYPPDDLLDYPHFNEICEQTIKEIAQSCKGITAIVGSPMENPEETGRRLYNAACILSNGVIQDVVYKTLLPTYDVFNESRYFEVNDIFKTVQINGIKTAITICEDLWHEMDKFDYQDNPLGELKAHEPNLVINISASPFNRDKMEERMEVLQKQSAFVKRPLVYVNQVGAHTDLIFDGRSCVVNSYGEPVMSLKTFEEDMAYIELNDIDIKPKITQIEEDDIEYLHKALVFGLRDYFRKMGFKKAVLGSSGGIDSAVVQALASEALGSENVMAVMMPSQFSSEGSVKDAVELSQNLGNTYEIIPIETAFRAFEQGLSNLFKGLAFNVAEENIQARSRAIFLMGISNKLGHILLNTSNKSEMSVGYSTLYGDMCGSLSVIGDVFKTDVYKLATFINREKTIIPDAIIYKAPSAELRPDQKDSDSLPEYDILDGILKQYIEHQKGPQSIVAMGYDTQTVERVIKLVNGAEYKRFQSPPILRVSPKAFGRGRIMPLVSRW
ncbi:MAG: NAD+ synthase [Bacteroidetes bacterium]|nr:NAD+ synthase [Bacteroidota bacterium]